MTTQVTAATVSGPTGGKSYSDTSTDGAFDGNNLLDTVSGSDVGFVQAGQSITNICVTYTAGAALWRLQDRGSLIVKRTGFCSKTGTVDYDECNIAPIVIAPEDILTVYPVIVDATANQTNALAWVQTSKGPIGFGATDIVDSTSTEMTSLITAQSLGEFFGSILTGIQIQAEDGASLTSVDIIGADGGTVARWLGTVRDAGHYYLNLDAPCGIPIEKGTVIKVSTVTA